MIQNSPLPQKRHNLFFLAFKHLPTGLLATAIGVAALSAPFLYGIFRKHVSNSFIDGALLTGVTIIIIPFLFLYLVTLLRSPKIRGRIETEAERELSEELEELQEKEKKEEKQVQRLEEVVKVDLKERKEKDKVEDERWDLLNESLRLQKETAELASAETVIVAKQVKNIKEEGEVALKEYATDDVEARLTKEKADEAHWESLDKRMHEQEEQNIERDKQQVLRDEEHSRILQALQKDVNATK
jgi:hypothetical protein